MITKTELIFIDIHYFNVLQMGCFAIYLQSKNPKNFWAIHVEEYPSVRHFKIYHKLNSHEEYHKHRDARSLMVAIAHIKIHDAFQLNGRKPIKEIQIKKA